jgi:putative tryptophan/tyrosine transport system substrate-binding protein
LRSTAQFVFLASYGRSQEACYPHAAETADKLSRCEKAGDIPIGRPTRFELLVNRKTAMALGLTISPNFLIRADELME